MDSYKFLITLSDLKFNLNQLREKPDDHRLQSFKELLLDELQFLIEKTGANYFKLKKDEIEKVTIKSHMNILSRFFLNMSTLKFNNAVYNNWESRGKYIYFIDELEGYINAIILFLKRNYL